MKKYDFAVQDLNFITLNEIIYKDVKVPENFVFDGVTVKAPFTFLFSNKDLRKGIKASCIHDWMCNHKEQYKRKYATQLLIELWIQNGLPKWKSYIVYVFVELYQIFKNHWD